MKKKRLLGIAAALMCSSILLSGCSFSDVVDKLMNGTEKITSDNTEAEVTMEPGKTVDESIEAPTFTIDLTGVVNVVQNTVCIVQDPAVVNDGGEVSYIWYKNNVNSNGGGTVVEGETTENCMADTSETGTVFYYAVAVNTQGDRVNMSTSTARQINILPRGEWSQMEDGGWRYIASDGSYPSGIWLTIDSDQYHLDENGYRNTGWFTEGDLEYYFDEEGKLARNITTPDGFVTDARGVKVGTAETSEDTDSSEDTEAVEDTDSSEDKETTEDAAEEESTEKKSSKKSKD